MSDNIKEIENNKAHLLFKQKIFDRYPKCVISGADTILCDVCYISHKIEGDSEDINNGILLDAGLSKLFTNHLISIDPTTLCAIVNYDIQKKYANIAKYNGAKTIINQKSIKYIQKHYDIFLKKDTGNKANLNKPNVIESNDIVKKKIGRPDKDIYKDEQKKVLEKLLAILKINDNSKVFFCEDLSPQQKQDILDLIPDVKKYYKCGKWSMFAKDIDPEYKYFSLTKSILKAMDKKTKYINVKNKKTQIVEKKGLVFV